MIKEFFYRLSKKERIGLITAAVIVLAVFMDRVVISPMVAQLNSMDREIALSEKKLSHDLRNIHNKELIATEHEKYKNFIKQGPESEEENVSNMLSEIEGLARTAGVDLVDIKPQPSKVIDFYKEDAVEVKIEGPMDQIVLFLHKLNASVGLLRAVKCRLGIKQKDLTIMKASILITKVSI